MRKLLIVFCLFCFLCAISNAQVGVAPLSKGQTQLNMGLGFNTEGIPMYVGLDFAIHKDVTLGPQMNVLFDDNDTSLALLARADYHFNYLLDIESNWDLYAGGNAGMNFGHGDPLQLGFQVGARWYWSEKWGLNLEFGGGNIFGTTLGVSMKL